MFLSELATAKLKSLQQGFSQQPKPLSMFQLDEELELDTAEEKLECFVDMSVSAELDPEEVFFLYCSSGNSAHLDLAAKLGDPAACMCKAREIAPDGIFLSDAQLQLQAWNGQEVKLEPSNATILTIQLLERAIDAAPYTIVPLLTLAAFNLRGSHLEEVREFVRDFQHYLPSGMVSYLWGKERKDMALILRAAERDYEPAMLFAARDFQMKGDLESSQYWLRRFKRIDFCGIDLGVCTPIIDKAQT